MKHEIEIDDEAIFQRVREELNKFARVTSWGDSSGSVMAIVDAQVKRQVLMQIDSLDLAGLIKREVETYLMPTLLEAIRKQVEAEAKKQVKLAMSQREGA